MYLIFNIIKLNKYIVNYLININKFFLIDLVKDSNKSFVFMNVKNYLINQQFIVYLKEMNQIKQLKSVPIMFLVYPMMKIFLIPLMRQLI